jgi:hypothetical protein
MVVCDKRPLQQDTDTPATACCPWCAPPPGVSPALCSAADKPGGRKRRYGLSGAGAAAAAAAGGGLDVLPSALLLRPGFQPPKMRKGGS